MSSEKINFVRKFCTEPMETYVKEITAVSGELCEAMARLMPQLSPGLSVPTAEHLRQIVESDTAALFAVCIEGQITGVLTLVWYDVPSGRKAWVEDVVVDATARGCGAGRVLVAAAVEYAAKIGAGRVMLTSSPARIAAHALYRKMGFKEAETSVFVLETAKK